MLIRRLPETGTADRLCRQKHWSYYVRRRKFRKGNSGTLKELRRKSPGRLAGMLFWEAQQPMENPDGTLTGSRLTLRLRKRGFLP